MIKKIKILSFAFSALALLFWFNSGCSSDKLKLGLDDDTHFISRIRAYRAGVEVNMVDGVKVGEHVIIEGRAYNNNNTSVKDGSIAITSTDEKVAKILTSYRSADSFYGVVRGEAVGSIEILLSGGSITKPVFFGVSTSAVGENKPYIKFNNISSEHIPVGTARQYNANYVDSNGTVSTATALVWSLIPANDTTVAEIASQTKDSAIVKGNATGEVELFVRDAENTVAASVAIKVQ